MKNWEKVAIGAILVASVTLPIFRSGGKTGLTFWGWVRNHTIFGDPGPEYVPEEAYKAEMQDVACSYSIKQPKGDVVQVMAFYQISEESARKLANRGK